MKRLSLILSLLLAVLASCMRPAQPVPAPEAPQHDTLAAFDTLMQSQPDSALHALLHFNSTHKSLAPFDRHYADLLLSEALFKNDCEQTARPALLDALNYFDSLAAAQPKSEDFFLLSARAHYMNGVGLVEADSVVEACAEYLKALEIMEDRFDEKELTGYKAKFMALTYNRLGDLFFNQYMMNQSIICFKKVLFYNSKKATSSYGNSKTFLRIGAQYNMMNQNDSAIYYYNLALDNMPDTNNYTYRDIITAINYLNCQMGNTPIEESLHNIIQTAQNADSDNEINSRYLVIAEIYYKQTQIDSAKTYFEHVFCSSNDIPSKIQSAEYLQRIHNSIGESKDALYYADFLSPYAVAGYEKELYVSTLNEIFQKHLQEKTEKKHLQEKYSLKNIILIISVLALIIIPIIVYTVKRRSKKTIAGIKDYMKQREVIHSAKVDEIKTANIALQEENKMLADKIIEITTKPFDKIDICQYDSLMHEIICINLLNRFNKVDIVTSASTKSYSKYAISQKEERELINVIEKHCPNFRNKIAILYSDITKTELYLCHYFLIGLTEPKIAILLQKSFSSLWKSGLAIRGKMNCADIKQQLKQSLFECANVEIM